METFKINSTFATYKFALHIPVLTLSCKPVYLVAKNTGLDISSSLLADTSKSLVLASEWCLLLVWLDKWTK
jgi:hypothetical protein